MEALVSALDRELPEWDITHAEGGWSLWITLPSGSAAALAQVALRHGVAIAVGVVTMDTRSRPSVEGASAAAVTRSASPALPKAHGMDP